MPFDPIAHTRGYASGGGEFVKFPQVGSWCDITVTNARPFTQDDEEITALDGTDTNGNKVTLTLERGKGQAVLEAVTEVRWVALIYPFRFVMQCVGEKDTGKGNPMKLYKAQITPLSTGPAVSSLPGAQPQGPPPAPPPAPPAPFQGPGPFDPQTVQQPPQAPGGPPPGQPWTRGPDGQWQNPAAAPQPPAPTTAQPAPPNGQGSEDVGSLFR